MKKLLVPVCAALILLVAALVATSSPVVVAGSPLTVNNTTTTGTVAVAWSQPQTLSQWSIQHGALVSTNDIAVGIYINTTSNIVNAVLVGTWHPSFTNAATEIVYPGFYSVTNFTFPAITTTNSQNIYIQYGQ